jgi:hypothetical protein
MQPNTAICFIVLGAALWMLQKEIFQSSNSHWNRRAVARAGGIFAACMGAAVLSEYLFGYNTGLDELLFRESLRATGHPFPGRMAPAAAAALVALGTAVALANSEPLGMRLSRYFALTGLLIGLFTLWGYAYQARTLYRIPAFSSLGLHTALLFCLLGAAVCCAQLNYGSPPAISSKMVRALLERGILPVALAVPIVIGWLLRLHRRVTGSNGTEVGFAVYSLSNLIIISGLVSLGFWSLHEKGQKREEVSPRLEVSQGQSSRLAKIAELFGTAIFEERRADELGPFVAPDAEWSISPAGPSHAAVTFSGHNGYGQLSEYLHQNLAIGSADVTGCIVRRGLAFVFGKIRLSGSAPERSSEITFAAKLAFYDLKIVRCELRINWPLS